MTKKTTSLLSAALLATTLGATALPSQAATWGVTVDVAPPAPRYEVVPEPRRGWSWVPGHWNWNGHRYVWAPGVWVRARPGWHYAEPSWVERDGRWALQRGHWARGDRDHDGVPNRYDRDRDNDGVPNRYDHHPNDPYRR
jgi:hypothetical protein